MIVPLGLDFGNAAMKIAGPHGQTRTLLPHTLAFARGVTRDSNLVPAGADPLDYLHVELGSHTLVGPVEVFAGALAAREYPDRLEEPREGERKATSNRHLLLALAGMAAALARVGYAGGTVALHLAVALPMAEVTDAGARRMLATRLGGRHQVRWISTPGWAGQTVTLAVERIDVVPEGAAAYLELAARRPELLEGYTLVLDVGARSLDWAAFSPGGRFALGLSGGTADGGINVAADRILAAARRRYGPHVARHRNDVLQALEAGAQDGSAVYLWARGRRYDVTELAWVELGRLARDVSRFVAHAVDQLGRVDHLALVGGGGALLAPYLQESLELPLTVADAPEWANAQGLYRRAQQLSRGEAG